MTSCTNVYDLLNVCFTFYSLYSQAVYSFFVYLYSCICYCVRPMHVGNTKLSIFSWKEAFSLLYLECMLTVNTRLFTPIYAHYMLCCSLFLVWQSVHGLSLGWKPQLFSIYNTPNDSCNVWLCTYIKVLLLVLKDTCMTSKFRLPLHKYQQVR